MLCITYLFPPIANSGTQRSVKFTKYLPEFGWQPVVLTVDNGPEVILDSGLEKELAPELQIHRVEYTSQTWARRLSKLIPNGKKFESGLEWRLRKLWQWPDYTTMWQGNAVKKGVELAKENNFSMIYASGTPWTSFLVAKKISEITGIPYVLDYRDLWTNIDGAWERKSKLAEYINERYEKKAVKNAEGIVSVTDSLVSKLSTQFSHIPKNKFRCITNGFDYDDFPDNEKTNSSKAFIISYTGVWKEGYGPDILYKAISELVNEKPLLNLKVIAAGFPKGKAAEYKLSSDTVEELGFVSHHDALLTMQMSDALFLPVARGEYSFSSLPGKLFEYIGSGKKIIASVPQNSEVDKLLKKVGGAKIVEPNNIKSLKDAIVALMDDNIPLPARNSEQVKMLERRSTTKSLATFFDNLLLQKK